MITSKHLSNHRIKNDVPPRFRSLSWLALFICVIACRRADTFGRVEVRGNVTYRGAPVEHGRITFRPTPGASGPATGIAIVDGKFLLPAEKGPIAGPHEVEVKIVDIAPNSGKNNESAAMTHGVQQLNSFSQHVDITNGVNQFDFTFPSDTSPAPH